MGICSHRKSHLKSFLQGIFIGRIGGGTFWRLRQKHQRKQTSEGGISSLREASRGPINLTNPRLARTKVESLSSLTH